MTQSDRGPVWDDDDFDEVDVAESTAAVDKQPAPVELELPDLQKTLASLTADVEAAQAKLLKSVDAKHTEFLKASSQIKELRGNVTTLHNDLAMIRRHLAGEDVSAAKDDDTEVSFPGLAKLHTPLIPRRLRAAAASHHALTAELRAVDSATEVLNVLHGSQQKLEALDNLTNAGRLCQAAMLTTDIAEALNSISAPSGSREPTVLLHAKDRYYKARSALISKLEDALNQLIAFGSNSLTIRSSVALGSSIVNLTEVWNSFQVLNLRSRYLQQFSMQVQNQLLSPVLACSSSSHFEVSTIKSSTEVTWSWQLDYTKSSTEAPISSMMRLLESFIAFLEEHVSCGLGEVFSAVGFRLSPWLFRTLIRSFNGADEELEDFEHRLFAKGFISKGEKTLSRHAQKNRQASIDQRRTALLDEARRLLLSDPSKELLQVSSESRPSDAAPHLPDIHISRATERFVRMLETLFEEIVDSCAGRGSDIEKAKELNRLVRQLCSLYAVLRPYSQQEQLRNDAGLCSVFISDCLFLVHKLLCASFVYGLQVPNDLQSLVCFIDLVPQLRRLGETHFFAMLKNQKEKLLQVLQPCILGPGIAKDLRAFNAADAALGAAAQQLKVACQAMAVSLPRQLLKEVTTALLGALCQELLTKLLRPPATFSVLTETSETSKAKPEAQIEKDTPSSTPSVARQHDLTAGVSRVFDVGGRLLDAAWRQGGERLLPGSVVTGASNALGELAAAARLDKPLSATGPLTSEEFSCISALLASALTLGRQVLVAAELLQASPSVQRHRGESSNGSSILEEVPGWIALAVSAELIGSDFSRFLEHRDQLLKAFKRDEGIRLMQLSWYDEHLTAEEAWDVLLRASST